MENFEFEAKNDLVIKNTEKIELTSVAVIMKAELESIFEEYANSISRKEKQILIKGLYESVEKGD